VTLRALGGEESDVPRYGLSPVAEALRDLAAFDPYAEIAAEGITSPTLREIAETFDVKAWCEEASDRGLEVIQEEYWRSNMMALLRDCRRLERYVRGHHLPTRLRGRHSLACNRSGTRQE
jgi:hypothetical protein